MSGPVGRCGVRSGWFSQYARYAAARRSRNSSGGTSFSGVSPA